MNRLDEDWFQIADEDFEKIRGVPGWRRVRGRLWAHQTHIPLIDGSEYKRSILPVARDLFNVETAKRGYELRDYQFDGYEFLKARRGGILGDQPRLGKTAVIASLLEPADGPALIVAPLAVRPVWTNWLWRVHPGAKIAVVQGKQYDIEKVKRADFIFCHYDLLWHWQDFHRGSFSTVVFDEAHLLTNLLSKRGQAALWLSTRAERTYAMTGTPIWNKPSGFYSLLKIVCRGGWGTYQDFTQRYASGHPGNFGWETGEPDNVDELQCRLQEVLIARTWHQVRTNLPTVDRSVEVAQVSPRDVIALDNLIKEARKDANAVLIGENAKLRKLVAKHKVGPAARLATTFLQSGEPCVIWVWHRAVADALEQKLKTWNPVVITGDTPEEKRDGLLDTWRSSCAPLIISLAIGQVGIDLSHARHCIMCELDYTPAVLSQAEMRTFHPDRPMTVTYVVAEHYLERALVRIIASKCEQALSMGVSCADTALDVLAAAFDAGDEKADLDVVFANMVSS